MVHVFRLGPFEAGRRKAYAYGGVDESGNIIEPAVEHTDAKALAAIAKRHAGQPLRCEPSLAEVAQPFGFEPAPLPESALLPRATLAYGLAHGPAAGRPNLDVLVRFFQACTTYWRARPWDLIDSYMAVPITLGAGGRARQVEASVMGSGGQEFGLAVYDEPGSIERVGALVDQGRMQEVLRVAANAVTLDEEPAWAVEALKEAFGLERLPVPMRIRKGKAGAPANEDLLDLSAALEAVAALASSEEAEDAEATAEAGGRSVTARALLPDFLEEGEEELAEPMLVPEPISATKRSKTPRNAPCPCGSGRKYKKCHLAEEEAREAAARGSGEEAEEARAHQRRLAERDPVHGLDERITADALALARQRWGRAFDPEAAFARAGIDYQVSQALLGWAAGEYRGPGGQTALDLYLEERGGALDAEARALVEAGRAAWFSYHEVIGAIPGQSITLRDLLAGEERTVQEKTASRSVHVRDVLLARVVALPDRAILAGCHLRSLRPRDGEEARRRLRAALKVRSGKLPMAKLREAGWDGTLFRIWQDLVNEGDARPMPRLQNTDGEELILTVDRFNVAAGKEAEVLAGLEALPDAQREDDEDGSPVVCLVKEGNAKGLMETTLIGRAIVGKGILRLETNSRERADRLRGLAEAKLGALVTFRVREHSDPVAQIAKGGRPAGPAAREPMPPEALEMVRQMQAEHYRRWVDEEIPALGGLTPREAAKRKGAARKQLELLLAEFENAEARRPEAQRFDVSILRRELGFGP